MSHAIRQGIGLTYIHNSNSVQVWFGIQIMNHECTITNYIDLNVNVTYVKTYDLKSD